MRCSDVQSLNCLLTVITKLSGGSQLDELTTPLPFSASWRIFQILFAVLLSSMFFVLQEQTKGRHLQDCLSPCLIVAAPHQSFGLLTLLLLLLTSGSLLHVSLCLPVSPASLCRVVKRLVMCQSLCVFIIVTPISPPTPLPCRHCEHCSSWWESHYDLCVQFLPCILWSSEGTLWP